jgi:hypothetical protein
METDLSVKIADLVRRRFGSGAEVNRVEPLAGDASTRRYARAWLRGAGTPPTAVIMILADRGVAISWDAEWPGRAECRMRSGEYGVRSDSPCSRRGDAADSGFASGRESCGG